MVKVVLYSSGRTTNSGLYTAYLTDTRNYNKILRGSYKGFKTAAKAKAYARKLAKKHNTYVIDGSRGYVKMKARKTKRKSGRRRSSGFGGFNVFGY